ncbi:50S ribosomal protein L1 [Patescibacteria group bacterium]|nr:50S ribosomal protein L1 [Patescibacteria group bacterium]
MVDTKKQVSRSAGKRVSKKTTVSEVQPSVARRAKGGRGKKYLDVVKLVDRVKLYPIQEALDLLVQTSPVKFDATVEAHIQTGLDPKQADQNIRGTVAMPAGLGKDTTVLVFAEGAEATEAKKAGADFVGSEDLVEKIKNGWLGFNVAIATPEMMVKIGKIGKILGTKGLMPNPKTGTVTKDVTKAVTEFKKGKVEFRLDKDAIIHVGFGKISLGKDGLTSNFATLFKALSSARPASAKGTYLQKIVLASTMGPGIKVDLSSL